MFGAQKELRSLLRRRLAVPGVIGVRDRYAHCLYRVTHLVADVDAIGQLPAEHAEMLIRQVDVQRMLAR